MVLFEGTPRVKPWVIQTFLTFDYMESVIIHWKTVEQYFTMVLFVFQSFNMQICKIYQFWIWRTWVKGLIYCVTVCKCLTFKVLLLCFKEKSVLIKKTSYCLTAVLSVMIPKSLKQNWSSFSPTQQDWSKTHFVSMHCHGLLWSSTTLYSRVCSAWILLTFLKMFLLGGESDTAEFT